MNSSISKILCLCFTILGFINLQARIIYVDDDATGLNNGTSWADAYNDLQAGLLEAQSGDEIWVAKGIYKPTNGTNRTIAFELKNGVAIYGGFEGTESALDERDLGKVDALQAYVATVDLYRLDKLFLVNNFSASILSGNIGNQNNVGDNSFNVVRGENIDRTSVIEAFAIMEGDANTTIDPYKSGGGMFNKNSSPSISRCSFLINRSNDNGGGMSNNESAPFLYKCYFKQNYARFSGAGIANQPRSSPQLANCIFRSNTAGINGGGMFNGFTSSPNLTNCIFELNNARHGGAMNNFNSSPLLINCLFEANTSNQKGGGMQNVESHPFLAFCEFVSNRAQDNGGGINNEESSPLLKSCSFSQNYSALSGGGISNQPSSSPTLDTCRFIANTAGFNGGGMFNGFDSSPKLDSCLFESNSAQNGGAMNNFRSSPHLINSVIKSNTAIFGGGIYSRISGEPKLTNCFLSKNEAIGNGGGMYNESCPLKLENCILDQNIAINGSGGGVYNLFSFPNLISSDFIQNKAQLGDGGGMFNRNSAPSLNECNFKENTAANSGGGMYNDSTSLLNLNNCNFELNHAENGDGGGIYTYRGAVKNTLFNQNNAQRGGGIFANQQQEGELTISNSTFSNNLADQHGGGIYNRQSITLLTSTLYQNKANSGANIYLDTQSMMSVRQNIIAGDQNTVDFHLASSAGLTSGGNNIVGNGEGFTNWDLSDLVGSTDAFMNPLLDSLADNGGATWTHATQTGSPAINGGAFLFLLPVDVLRDQRGYSRLTSPQDSLSDIGAYERHSTQIDSKNFFFCIDTNSTDFTDYFLLEDIVLSDPSGGAFAAGNALSLKFKLSDGFEFKPNVGNVEFQGNEIRGSLSRDSISITTDTLTITYDRFFTTDANSIIISGLEVRARKEDSTGGSLIRIESDGRNEKNAVQIGNMPEDSVSLISFYKLPVLYGNHLSQNFNTNNGGWFPLSENNLWEWKKPDGEKINANSTGKAWTTLGKGEKYEANNMSILVSSCFDLSQLAQPFIALDIWSDAQENFDGTVLQYKRADAKDWTTIGDKSTGIGWYDTIPILSQPGIAIPDPNKDVFGWTGRDTTWISAKHSLLLTEAERLYIQFRMVFASGPSVHPNRTNNGFAFDNFSIGDQNIKLLFEQFTNQEKVNSTTNLLSANAASLIPIKYFVEKGEEFYEKNSAGPRTRALYYGISEPGVSVISGINYSGPTDDLRQNLLDRSKLRGSIVNIEIDSSKIDATVQIEANQMFPNQELLVYMALVENSVVSGTTTYDHVFRKFLPNAAGISYWNWTGETIIFPLSWFESQFSIRLDEYNTNNLQLVVFVQNQQTKEVYQATSAKVWPALVAALEKREAIPPPKTSLALYPNPAADYLILQMEAAKEEAFKVSLYNLQGALVKDFLLDGEQNQYKLEIHDIASGWYYIRVGTNNQIWLQDRVTVVK